MALPGKPLSWSPKGASDTLDSSTAPNGAMAQLANLIPDPSTRDLWQCRPAAVQLDVSNPFTTPTCISCLAVIGTRAYGMISTARNPGKDEPFVFDIPTASFITVSGVTNVNTPNSPATSGAWSPPSIALIGVKLIITHPGFTGAGGVFFGVIDISNPAAPAYSGANTATTALPSVPVWVSNFNGRAYYLVNPPGATPAAYVTDVLDPLTITIGTHIITFDDNVPLTCAGPLPLFNQLGGIIQSLIVFKGVTNLYQITGDFTTNDLVKNTLNVATGTLAPNSLATTSKGLAFMAPDGLRMIDFHGTVSDPVGAAGEGITVPFINALVPSRMAAAYNSGVYRIQVQNGQALGSPQQQWWYDFVRGLWSGPHTQIAGFLAAYSNTFIVTQPAAGAHLYQSDPVQTPTSTYTEAGVALSYSFTTPMFPDTEQMAEIAMIEATLNVAFVAGTTINVVASDQDGTVLDLVTLTAGGGPSVWGAFQWGQALWGAAVSALYPRRLQWHQPIVFRRVGLTATGRSGQNIKIGRVYMRYEILGYLQQGG